MNLGPKAMSVLENWGAFTDDRRTLTVDADRFSIAAEVCAADKLSCSISQLRVEPHSPGRLTTDALREWGNRISKRVRYLLEAIETVELDATHGRLLVRSTPPERKPDGTVLYYELMLEATGRLSLERRRFEPKGRQYSSEPMHCTRELLAKLIDDLAATAV